MSLPSIKAMVQAVPRSLGSYGPVLREIDLVASAGEFVAIVGASGRGKSTPLRLIAGPDLNHGGDLVCGGVRGGSRILSRWTYPIPACGPTNGCCASRPKC